MKYLIIIRHEKHKNSILSPETVSDCKKRGKKLVEELKKRKIPLPNLAICSNRKRSIDTLQSILDGMNINLPISELYEELSDYRSGKFPFTDEEVNQSRVKAAQDNSDDFEPYLLPLFPKKVKQRAMESVGVLKKCLQKNKGTIILCSHGCSRLEGLTSVFQKKPVNKPSFFYERGAIAILTFTNDLKLKNVKYLGKLV